MRLISSVPWVYIFSVIFLYTRGSFHSPSCTQCRIPMRSGPPLPFLCPRKEVNVSIDAWQVLLGLHNIFMRDGVLYEPHSRVYPWLVTLSTNINVVYWIRYVVRPCDCYIIWTTLSYSIACVEIVVYMLCVFVQVGVQNTLGIWPYHINQEVPMIEMEYTRLLFKIYRAQKSRSSNHLRRNTPPFRRVSAKLDLFFWELWHLLEHGGTQWAFFLGSRH